MILAAGMGTRLRPMTETVPKALIEVAGQPMISFPLKLLRAAGIQEVMINLHHLGEQIRQCLGDGHQYGVEIRYSEEDPILETGGGIGAARDFLGGGTFVVLNADTFCELDINQLISWHTQQRGIGTLVLRRDPDAVRRDHIAIDSQGGIRRFLGKNYPVFSGKFVDRQLEERLFFAGIQVLEPRIFDYMQGGAYSMTHEIYPRVLAAGELLGGYLHDGYWQVLDTPKDLAIGRREIPKRLQINESGG